VVWYYDMIYIFNCNCVDTRWQQYSTHLHTNNTRNTENGTYITIKKLGTYITIKKLGTYITIKKLGTYITIKKFKTNLGSAGRAPYLRVIPWHVPYNWGKSTEKYFLNPDACFADDGVTDAKTYISNVRLYLCVRKMHLLVLWMKNIIVTDFGLIEIMRYH
jgi:hypothetical protein